MHLPAFRSTIVAAGWVLAGLACLAASAVFFHTLQSLHCTGQTHSGSILVRTFSAAPQAPAAAGVIAALMIISLVWVAVFSTGRRALRKEAEGHGRSTMKLIIIATACAGLWAMCFMLAGVLCGGEICRSTAYIIVSIPLFLLVLAYQFFQSTTLPILAVILFFAGALFYGIITAVRPTSSRIYRFTVLLLTATAFIFIFDILDPFQSFSECVFGGPPFQENR